MGVRVQMSNPQFTRDASVRTSYAILFVVKVLTLIQAENKKYTDLQPYFMIEMHENIR